MNLAYRLAAGGTGNLPRLPGSLHLNRRLSQWLRFLPDGSIEVRSGKVEIGQGIATALAQIAAEELDVGIERIRMVAASTAGSPNEGVTSGSLSIHGQDVEIEFRDGEAIVYVTGRFDVLLDGRGEVESARGHRIGWGLRPRTVRIDGFLLADAPPAAGDGVAA